MLRERARPSIVRSKRAPTWRAFSALHYGVCAFARHVSWHTFHWQGRLCEKYPPRERGCQSGIESRRRAPMASNPKVPPVARGKHLRATRLEVVLARGRLVPIAGVAHETRHPTKWPNRPGGRAMEHGPTQRAEQGRGTSAAAKRAQSLGSTRSRGSLGSNMDLPRMSRPSGRTRDRPNGRASCQTRAIPGINKI